MNSTTSLIKREEDDLRIGGRSTSLAVIPLEIRLRIWALVYVTQGPRLVEVRTAEHDHYLGPHLRWCPRYSPSPPPTVVNVCREARAEAHKIAERAGHLIFDMGTGAPKIYFNPEIDTLYVPNEKHYWIRDWGPEGILTELKCSYSPESLRSLAIGLDPLSRATTPYSLLMDLLDFQLLETVIFVTENADPEVTRWIEKLDRRLACWERDGGGLQGKVRHHPYPTECGLAICQAGRLVSIKKEKRREL
jgi:hypothetical protein